MGAGRKTGRPHDRSRRVATRLAPFFLLWAFAPTVGQEEDIEVTLLLVDVVVIDKKGQPIPDLSRGDFELLVDNVSVPISSHESQCSSRPESDDNLTAASPMTPRDLIVVFDMSHLIAIPRRNAIRATIRFIDESMASDDRVMILALMRGIHVISPFTSDREALRERLTTLLDNRSLTDTAAFEEEVLIERLVTEAQRARYSGLRLPPGQETHNAAECLAEARIAEIDSARTLRALSSTMPVLGARPGRKAMVLFTETLRADPGIPFYSICRIPSSRRVTAGLTSLPETEDLILQANLSGVSLYMVGAGGLSHRWNDPGEDSARDLQVSLALSTGGERFSLMNDTQRPFKSAIRDLSCHHILGYEPARRFESGRHTIEIFVRRKGARIRHREYFTVPTKSESTEHELIAALSSPSMYQDLEVRAHGYSLGPSGRSSRRFHVQASVPIAALIRVPGENGRLTGDVSIRGAMIARDRLTCEFFVTVPFYDERESRDVSVGVASSCDLDPGEHEILVAARDEHSGSLGAFWGRVSIERPENSGGNQTLIWAAARRGETWRWTPAPASPAGRPDWIVRPDRTLGIDEAAAMTFLTCPDKRWKTGDPAPVVTLEGPSRLELPASPVPSVRDECRLMRVDLEPDALPAGDYDVTVRPGEGWTSPGQPAAITVAATDR